jgi:hypothetical protein
MVGGFVEERRRELSGERESERESERARFLSFTRRQWTGYAPGLHKIPPLAPSVDARREKKGKRDRTRVVVVVLVIRVCGFGAF